MVIIFFFSFWKTRVSVLDDLESVLHRIEEGVKDKAMTRTRGRDFLLTWSNDGFSHTEQFSNHHSFLDQMSYRENCMLDWTCLHHHFSNYCFFYIILKRKKKYKNCFNVSGLQLGFDGICLGSHLIHTSSWSISTPFRITRGNPWNPVLSKNRFAD